MKRILICTLCIFLLLPCALTVQAEEAVAHVIDEYEVLPWADVMKLEPMLAEASARMGCKVLVATYGSYGQSDRYLGEEYLREWGLSFSDDVILLIITENMAASGDDYYYDLYLYGSGEKRITQDEADTILDTPAVYSAIKSGRLMSGILAFAEVTEAQYANKTVRPSPYATAFPVALILALIIAGVAVSGVKKAYSTKKRSVDYPLDQFASLELTEQSDDFLGSFVTRRVISTGSSGRGGGGGGRGGGRGHAGGR